MSASDLFTIAVNNGIPAAARLCESAVCRHAVAMKMLKDSRFGETGMRLWLALTL